MFELLWLIPILPLAGFLVLVLFGARLPRRVTAYIGVGTVGVSALLALFIGFTFITAPPPGHAFSQTLWTWLHVGTFAPGITLYLDPLAVVMVLVITVVAFLIHLYSTAYMAGDEGYARFFAYMNLFVASMLILVLADNLLLLYLGWEGVGLCSYLLIGFWYTEPANVRAAMKAFIVTRVGDTALAIALFLLFTQFGTLQIQAILQRAPGMWLPGSAVAIAAAALLLGGAVGKSAQLPLQTWLPDAMAGPTPVSALIHAATMVTAGVYLIARTNTLFTLAPPVQHLVAIIGAATLLLAACSALVQTDIKRILAYSTMSQVGYMFLALGVGAWSAAIFHFMTHAFFKALLFLGAGVVILSLHEEHDIFKMGGLWRKMPLTFWTFLIGALSLAAFPFITAGFFSKDLIVFEEWGSVEGNPGLWTVAMIGAFLTAVYTFRMVFLVFFGKEKTKPEPRRDWQMALPLVVLAVLSVIGGDVDLPRTLGNLPLLTDFLRPVLPDAPLRAGASSIEPLLMIASALTSLAGILLAYFLYLRRPVNVRRAEHGNWLARYFFAGWGFDWLYYNLFVRPYVWFAHVDKHDIVDAFFNLIAGMGMQYHELLSTLQSGKVRWYALGIAVGAVIVIAILVLT